MNDITLIVLSAGNSSRFTLQVKKQWLRCEEKPLWLHVTKKLSTFANFKEIIVIGHINELNYMQNFSDEYLYVVGGGTRQESMENALEYVTTKYVMITDVARSCIPKKVIQDLIKNKEKADCIVPFIPITDSVVYNNKMINRDNIKVIQTPQLSLTNVLKKALNTIDDFTDDSSAIQNIGGSVYYIDGDILSKKLTTSDEIAQINCLAKPSSDYFTGIGFDIHPFES